MKSNVKRLYNQFQPSLYKLSLSINEDEMTFSGTVTIEGKKVGRPSQRITLHQKDLTVTSAVVTHKDKSGHRVKEIARINNHASYDEVRLHTHENLFAGQYQIELAFHGKITRNMNGMYPCFYEQDGAKKQFIATQFESHHAREVFPCVDEPEAKAVFALTLHTRPTIAVANTPVVSQSTTGDVQTTTFEPTPLMSTYLLAFVIGDMKYKQAQTKRGVEVRTFSTPANVDFTDFALETAVRCIDFYEDYFGIEYPLPKSDLLALPDFASGAMENWGCITFREQCMLVDPKNTSLPTKQYVAMVVAHELAHMWFGNLVTMRWWTDLWLNEGFASWVEYLAVDTLFPEWNMWTQFVVDEQQQAMKLDSLDNTHPIEVPVHHPDEIRTIFDTISYAKGASVIHQLYSYLGPDTFKKGLQLYLKKHSYKNTDTKDLWESLSEASGKDVSQFMHAWTAEPGFPIVHVNKTDTALALTQKRFYLIQPSKLPKKQTWHIPLLSNLQGMPQLLTTERTELPLDTKSALLLNTQRSGFYRVSYDETSLDELATLLDEQKLEPLDRLGLLADMLEASKSGDTSTVSTLKFLQHYRNESSAVVWDIIASIIGSIRLVHGDDELREAIKPFIVKLAEPEYKRLGWHKKESDTYFDQLLRPTILGLLAGADYEPVVDYCFELFNKASETEDIEPQLRETASTIAMKRDVYIDPDARGVVFGTVARRGDMKTFDKLLAMYNKTDLSEEKLTYAAALTDFKDEACIDRALGLITTDAVRLQDVSYWVAYSFMNHQARAKTWQWLKDNWIWLEKNLGTDLSFYRTPIYAARVHSDEAFTKDYITFFSARMTPALDRSYKQGLEMLAIQTAWRHRDHKDIVDYFNQVS